LRGWLKGKHHFPAFVLRSLSLHGIDCLRRIIAENAQPRPFLLPGQLGAPLVRRGKSKTMAKVTQSRGAYRA